MPKRKQQVPLWDWTKGITQSAITDFLNCREQFSLKHLEGWTRKGFSLPMEFGTVFHFCLRDEDGDPEKTVKGISNAYFKSRKSDLAGEDSSNLEKMLAQIEVVFPLYCNHWRKENTKLRFLNKETSFRTPYTFLSRDSEPITIDLRGCRDGEYHNSQHKLGLFETKTKSVIDNMAIQSQLRADLQTMFYLLSLQKDYSETPEEITYNVIRRPALRVGQTETLPEYKDRLTRDIQNRPDWYFARWEVTVIPQDLENFKSRILDPVLRQLYEWWRSVENHPFDRFQSLLHFINLNALQTKYGKAPLYDLIVLGRKKDYCRQLSVFPELSVYSDR
jgi:hypothetical protein